MGTLSYRGRESNVVQLLEGALAISRAREDCLAARAGEGVQKNVPFALFVIHIHRLKEESMNRGVREITKCCGQGKDGLVSELLTDSRATRSNLEI